MTKPIFFICVSILHIFCTKVFAQSVHLKAVLANSNTKKIIKNAYILNANNFIVDSTSSNGKFELIFTNPKGIYSLYKSNYFIKKITIKDAYKDTIYLNPIQEKLSEILIQSKRQKQLLNIETGTNYLNRLEITNIPSILGDQDILKYLALSPGIQPSMEGQSGFFVRGGNSSMNYFELDNMYLHQINHLGGLYNAINSDMIQSVRFSKSCFDANFGNRMSSVTEMKSLNNPKHLNGKISLGILASKGTINIPINETTSLLFSGRRTYLDLIKNLFSNDNENSLLYKNTNYSFYDYYLKLKKSMGQKSSLNFKVFKTKDNYLRDKPSAESFKKGSWSNIVLGTDWSYLFSENSKNTFQINYSGYSFNFSEKLLSYDYDLNNYYRRFSIENTFYRTSTLFNFSAGINYNFIKNNTKKIEAYYNNNLLNVENSPVQNSNIISIYAQIKSVSFNDFDFKLGGRLTHYNYGSKIDFKTNNYLRFDPRLALSYNINNKQSIKFSYQNIHQFLHQTTITSFSLPSDFYLLSNATAKPQFNHMFNLEHVVFLKNLSLTSGFYYNKVLNFSELKNGTLNNLFNSNLYSELVFGKLMSYGLELSLNTKIKNVEGNINYTFSNSEVQFADLNDNLPFKPVFDRPHNLNISLSYNINKRIKLGGLFMFFSGQNYSEPTAIRIIEELPILEYSSTNNNRFPSYHRLDLSINYKLKKTKKLESNLNLTVYNCYNRKNPFYINYESTRNTNSSITLTKENLYLFPIIPTINWNLTFF